MTETLPKQACLLGWPVSQSLSPKVHTYWLKKYGIDGTYTSMAVVALDLKNALDTLRERGYAGCNLTMPLKETAMPFMDIHDESCVMSGAVNTIVIMRDGKYKGFNTDGFGFMESLKAQAPDWKGDKVVVLGAGGAARGIIASLKGAGAKKFVIANRTTGKAERIIKQFKLEKSEVVAWKQRQDYLHDATLLINCTSLGMKDEEPLPMDLKTLPPSATVCDIVYRPAITPLIAAAKKRGNPVAGGLPMLLHQGRIGFEQWFGRDPEVTPEMLEEIAKAAA